MPNENRIKLVGDNQIAIQLSFGKLDDRWAHDWQWVDGDQVQTLLKSREGSQDQNWPPSPPLQEISHHELPSGEAILGVGMAGKGHWSASFSMDDTTSIVAGGKTETGTIKADLACLQKSVMTEKEETAETWTALGSSYETGSCEIEQVSDQQVRLVLPQATLVLEAISNGEMQTRLKWDGLVLRVIPVEFSNSPVAATRWGYRLQFAV